MQNVVNMYKKHLPDANSIKIDFFEIVGFFFLTLFLCLLLIVTLVYILDKIYQKITSKKESISIEYTNLSIE